MIEALPVATAPALAAIGLSAGYHGVPVLSEIDLEVRAGEVVALFGPNGAGKTTTLMALAGELRPTGGLVSFLGDTTPPALYRRAQGGLGLLTEDRCVFMNLTARENLRLGRGTIAAALALFPELEPHLGKRAGLLSGGQQQMLALARVFIHGPEVLLIDELSLGLAPVIVQRMLELIDRLKEQGQTMIIVEQSLNVALAIADRAIFLEKGEVRFEGATADLLARDDLARAVFFGTEGG